MNSIFQMFNDPYIQGQARQYQAAMNAQPEHQEQVENIMKSAHKLQDYLDSLKDIKPEYREHATKVFCSMLLDFMYKNPHA